MGKRRTVEELRAAYKAKLDELDKKEHDSKAQQTERLSGEIAKLEAQQQNLDANHAKQVENYQRKSKVIGDKLLAKQAELKALSDDGPAAE